MDKTHGTGDSAGLARVLVIWGLDRFWIGEGTTGFSTMAASAPPPVEKTKPGLRGGGRFVPAGANTPPYRDETAKGWGPLLLIGNQPPTRWASGK